MRTMRTISRRGFLKTTALSAGGTMILGTAFGQPYRSGNIFPGRIALWENHNATDGSSINDAVVAEMVQQSLVSLTDESNPVHAMESLFPGINPSKKVAIKVNIISPYVPTRWEMVKALTDLLLQTCGGAFSPSNITIYDKIPSNISSTMAQCGFTAEHFPGMVILDESDPDPGTQVWVGDRYLSLSSHIVNADYLINCPVLKNHSQSGKYWTLAFKNHIGSVGPMSCLSYEPRILSLAGSEHIRNKTRLVALSGLFGIYVNGPEGPAQTWNLFPETQTPNLMILSTDPVSLEHWGIDLINRERALHGITVYNDSYCQNAALPPYELGLYDFSCQDIRTNLSPPENVTIHTSGSTVDITWDAVPTAQGYRVYRSADPYFAPDPWNLINCIGETADCFFQDNPDPLLDRCFYVIRSTRISWESSDSQRIGYYRYL